MGFGYFCRMGKPKKKYYVVWVGERPGIYDNWDKCKQQVVSYPDARYKSFDSLEAAENAFRENYEMHYQSRKSGPKRVRDFAGHPEIIKDSIAVDAACSGNPGTMEYRGVDLMTGQQLFLQGPFQYATNNIGEFLAIVHALALTGKSGQPERVIYSDSRTAISWVKNKKVKTELARKPENEIVFELIDRAINWLNTNTWKNPVIKWDTENWGEIPADFGRK